MSSMRTGLPQFFNVRGMVPRPLVIHVEHQAINKQPQITLFERGCPAGAHETDHLAGAAGPAAAAARCRADPDDSGSRERAQSAIRNHLMLLTLRRTTVLGE
jgi:hypothetical protein